MAQIQGSEDISLESALSFRRVGCGEEVGSNSGRQDWRRASLPPEPFYQPNLNSGWLQTHDPPSSASSTYPTSMCHNNWLCRSYVDNHGFCESTEQQSCHAPRASYPSSPSHIHAKGIIPQHSVPHPLPLILHHSFP